MGKESREAMKLLAVFSTIGISMAACVFVGLGFGYYLDNSVFNGRTSPWFTFIFLAFGVFAGYKNLYQMTQRKDL